MDKFFKAADFLTQYQALGVLLGVWFPRAAGSATGWILCDSGCTQVEATLSKDAKEYILAKPNIFSTLTFYHAYPKQKNGLLTVDVGFVHNPDGVEPETEAIVSAEVDRFRIRGDIVAVGENLITIHIAQNVKPGKIPNIQFELIVVGDLQQAKPGEFWEIYARRNRYTLVMESGLKIQEVDTTGISRMTLRR